MDRLDAVLYINLDHRLDRNEHILEQLARTDVSESKIHRISGIYSAIAFQGCSQSHVKALEFAFSHETWKTILVLEDDFTFFDCDTLASHIANLLDHDEHYEVCLLAFNPLAFDASVTDTNGVVRVRKSQTASGYIIQRSFIPTLLANFKDAISKGKCIDIHWHHLQCIGKWYACVPALGYQYASFSDILKMPVNYEC